MPEETAAGKAGTIGAEHVVGKIDSVLRTGRSFYRIDCADIIPVFIHMYVLVMSDLAFHSHVMDTLIEESSRLLIG